MQMNKARDAKNYLDNVLEMETKRALPLKNQRNNVLVLTIFTVLG